MPIARIVMTTTVKYNGGQDTIAVVATAVHLGRTTQVWNATVTYKDSGKTIALFRCTRMILYPKA